MRVVVALGGTVLMRRGEPATAETQQQCVAAACDRLAPLARRHELVISHGNGPQVWPPASADAAGTPDGVPCLDVLDAERQGALGYLMERELGNRIPYDKPLASLLTMIEVDPQDRAFAEPTEPIGPRYPISVARQLADEHGWTFRADGDGMRRVLPAPVPRHIFEHRPIRWLLERGCVVICAGGGIPTAYRTARQLHGVEAVIDKDLAGALLALDISADLLIMVTDTPAVYLHHRTADQQAIRRAHPDDLLERYAAEFRPGSMLPKVQAACEFVTATGRPASIGALADVEALLADTAGTRVSPDVTGIELGPPEPG